MTKKTINNEIRDYVMISIAMMSYCIGWNIFLLPNEITTGGVSGIASIIYWGTGIPVQNTYFFINAVLLVFAFKILGWKFCVKTVYAVTFLTIILALFGKYTRDTHLLADQPFMASIIGAIFCGSGVGLGLAFNGSTGGTDIIAAMINKYRDITLGRVILLCDIIIVTSSIIVLKDWEKVIYGYVVLWVVAFCIDQVINSRRRSVQFFIISEKYKEIAHAINTSNPHRGVTVFNGQGYYSGNDVKMLFVLAKRSESPMIFSIINEIDPGAFVSQSAVIGVYGKGFDHIKYHMKKADQEKLSRDGQ